MSESLRKSKISKDLLDIPDMSSDTEIDNTSPIQLRPIGDGFPSMSMPCNDSEGAERKTFRIEPPTELLSRLQSFLPQMADANQKLQNDLAQDPEKLDIENVGEDESQYIEMDLGLGVFDMKPKKDTSNIQIKTNRSLNYSPDASDDEEMDDRKIIINPNATKRHKGSSKPHIEVLGNKSSSDNLDVDLGSSSDSSSR